VEIHQFMKKEYFANSLQHILAELKRIDLLIEYHVKAALQSNQKKAEFQGLFISDKEAYDFVKKPIGQPPWYRPQLDSNQPHYDLSALKHHADEITKLKTESLKQGVVLQLEKLSQLFNLSPFETDVLLLCLAPEFDLKYERIYSYLQDDITRKRPSVDLVLNLLCCSVEEKLRARRRFDSEFPLFKHSMLYIFDDPSHQNPPLLSKFLKLDERVISYLLGENNIDFRLRPFTRHIEPNIQFKDLVLPVELISHISFLATEKFTKSDGLIFYFKGPYGVGKQSTAEAICESVGKNLLVLNGKQLNSAELSGFNKQIRLMIREAVLREAVIYIDSFDVLISENGSDYPNFLLNKLNNLRNITFLSGNTAWQPKDMSSGVAFIPIKFPLPTYNERLELWAKSLDGNSVPEMDADLMEIANKFRFSGGQIRDAVATAWNRSLLRFSNKRQINMNDLYTACRLHSNQKLATLSQKIESKFNWSDIVLPENKKAQLKEIIDYVEYKQIVFRTWGFDRKLSLGKGLSALFSGPSGTGKTMAAEILAGELELDLYKIDLSTVVSKYIGETEKNLSRIFAEAETSNAILFFDEADALFGKRSEVKDAHDRYANIEIGYLLQKMEEYDGITILATNLRKNMDDAFMRRMKFIVEFPFPDESHRFQIWQVHLPDQAPRGDDLDFEFLAGNFKLTGGNIRNIVLHAAFLAASKDAVITMKYLIQGIQREFQKTGKVCVRSEFGRYFEIVEGSDSR
jgi:SpoVK/Ycf46/Vps4 family AAA+-type ATPase